jgi:hypothetical protein
MGKNLLLYFSIFCSVSLITACNGSSGEKQNKFEDDESATSDKIGKAKNMLYLIPSPIETTILLKKAGAQYDKTLVNSLDNSSKYESRRSKAINLGIYGADLSYASMFDQTQEAMFYTKACKGMAESLGIMEAFDKETLDRIEGNVENQDSMLHIISETYWIADAYLKENENFNLSALIVVGGWIEGLYIATKIASNKPNSDGIIKRVADQKYALNNLVGLLNNNQQDEDIKYVLTDLNSLKESYDKLEISSADGENTVDEKTGVTTIGAKKEIVISTETISEITKKVNDIRTKYVQ